MKKQQKIKKKSEKDGKTKRMGKKKVLEGEVVSCRMEKTCVVKVTTKKQHPFYKKVITLSKKFKVHTEEKLKAGDRVRIEQARPISKEKRWRVVEVLKKDNISKDL